MADGSMTLPTTRAARAGARLPNAWSASNCAIDRMAQRSMIFVNRVAEAADEANHHPDIFISYNRVRLALSTHKVAALSCKDFVLAKQIDPLTGSGR